VNSLYHDSKGERLVNRNGVSNEVMRCDVGNDVRLKDEESTMRM